MAEQKLIDIMFELSLTMHTNSDHFKTQTREQVAEWVAEQLRICGYDTTPCGASWGILKEDREWQA